MYVKIKSYTNVTKDSFQEVVLKSDIPVLVDFNADWCGPCRMLKPILEELSSDRSDYKFVSVNIDNEEELAEKYGIFSIPCLIVFNKGKEIKRSVGFRPKSDIESMMEEL